MTEQGAHILTTLLECSSITTIHAYTRKPIVSSSDRKLNQIHEPDSNTWPTKYPQDTPAFISALGTTARVAGSFANQRKIDYDLNIALAQAAKDSGAKIYTLISTSGASTTSMVPYSRMKGELDEVIKTIGFEHVIILKPGLLVGTRSDSRPGEFMARKVASTLGMLSGNRLTDSWAQDAQVVARAAVRATLEALDGQNTEAVRVLGQQDIVRLGRTEWGNDT